MCDIGMPPTPPAMNVDPMTPVITVADDYSNLIVQASLMRMADHHATMLGVLSACDNTPAEQLDAWLRFGEDMANRIDGMLHALNPDHYANHIVDCTIGITPNSL